MKHFFLTALLFFCVIITNAQKGTNFLKIHGGAELTTGLFAEGYQTGWGVYVTDYYRVSDKTNISLSTGIASWKVKDDASFKIGMSLTRVGLQQYISNGFYLQGDAGVGVGLQKWSGTTKFVFGGGPGYLFKSKAGGGFDLSTRVNRGFNRTWIGLAAGYQFKL
jgi:hypothetical protein